MRYLPLFRLSRIAVATAAVALSCQPSWAQSVAVFDQAPTLEQLRSIMVPESVPGVSRAIVMQRHDNALPSPVTRVSNDVAPEAQPPAEPATPEPAPPPRRVTKPAHEVRHGTVGFRINFAFDSAVLPESGRGMMDTVVALMKETPSIRVRIEGHTDAVGAPGYNMGLSQRRALAVGEYLVRQGVDPSRLDVVGKGMSDPLTKNPYDAENRRVQFVRIG